MRILGTIASSVDDAVPTYDLISTVVVGSGGQTEIDFNNISGTYTDLILKTSTRADVDTVTQYIKFNNTITNQSRLMLFGTSGGVGGESVNEISSYGGITKSVATASTFSNVNYYIPNYAGSTFKMVSIESVNENNSTSTNQQYMSLVAGLWASTAAITRVTLWLSSTNKFVEHSSASLYGVLKK